LFARLTTYELEEGRASESIPAFEPAIERIRILDGLVDAFYLVERDGRRAVTMTIWDSVEAMERSRVAASNARTEAAREAGADVTSTYEFEIGIHVSGERANRAGEHFDTNVSSMAGNPPGRSFFS
jgi:heme-degrading monooxygenase HmoA